MLSTFVSLLGNVPSASSWASHRPLCHLQLFIACLYSNLEAMNQPHLVLAWHRNWCRYWLVDER